MTTPKKDPAAVSLGRRGGLARAATLTAAQRVASATKASAAAAKVRTKKAQEARKGGAR